ncbi:hypothetical protein M2651_00280 [Clostridium sp. SYSU_GA19001]|uniref:hypothetical protein n=1 Tax=Clostridium caldaquaticum TaxID=2940653 RepID=UPI002076F542|nr:hypothetical protein [Clostridium caldaquaticum]MCM8709459.1 hypothetical protein [Clostridium caldaquaticum]
MKKIVSALLSMFILITFTACLSSQDNKTKNSFIKNESNLDVVSIQQIKLENKPNILFTVTADASLKHIYSTVDEFNKSDAVDTIVKGTITNIEYVYVSGLAYSILTINVLQSYKGNCAKTIKVYEDGGYVKVKDKLDELKKHIDVEKLTQEQIDNGVIDIKFFNAPHAKKGQQVILYLTKNIAPLPTDSYRIVSSLYGKFTLDKSDEMYKRIALDTKDDTITNNKESENSSKIDLVTNFEKEISESDMEYKLTNLK